MGSVVISLDAELGWGFHHHEEPPVAEIRRGRAAWHRLCDLFDRLDIPATWGVVGHLFLEECDSVHDDHPAGQRPCAVPPDVAEELWFGGDVIDRVLNASVEHEIGSHGFTHVHFQHPRMTEEVAAREIRLSREAMAARGLSPTSFIFPVNKVGYRDLVADNEFTCYRGVQPAHLGRVHKLAAGLTGRRSPAIVRPRVDEFGLVNVPASLYLFSFEGIARRMVEVLRGDPIVNWVQRGLHRLPDEDGVLHLWLHPNNLVLDRDFARIRAILTRVARLRDRGEIRIETMGEVADRTADGIADGTADVTADGVADGTADGAADGTEDGSGPPDSGRPSSTGPGP